MHSETSVSLPTEACANCNLRTPTTNRHCIHCGKDRKVKVVIPVIQGYAHDAGLFRKEVIQ